MLLAKADTAMLHFSVRITHANDLYQTCLEHYVDASGQSIEGMNLQCYREGDGGMVARCRGTNQLVISPQSTARGVLGDNLERFRGGILVLDEAMSFALSLGGDQTDSTIKHHLYLANLMKQLAGLVTHVIVMDRDLTLTPLVSNMLAVIAPDRDITHVQFERPAQSNAFCYTFNAPYAPPSLCLALAMVQLFSDAFLPVSHQPLRFRRDMNRVGRGMSLAKARLELHMIQCIRTFERYPDTPTMKLSVQLIDEPLRLEGVVLNLGSDELYQDVTIKIARVEIDQEDAGVLHVILTTADIGHLELLKGDKLTSTQLPVDLVATDAITLKIMAVDDPVGSWDYTQSPEGPKERRRLWIACATKGFGESLVETCKQIGATYRFYHAGVGSKSVEGTSAKEDVKNTSAAWRNVHVIISTTTIEVAINVKLPFLARWLFATHHPGSLASELMQLVSRVPRGEEEVERNARLTDHRIFVLFST
eukprot:7391705-Prymnesium_polylepis.2